MDNADQRKTAFDEVGLDLGRIDALGGGPGCGRIQKDTFKVRLNRLDGRF